MKRRTDRRRDARAEVSITTRREIIFLMFTSHNIPKMSKNKMFFQRKCKNTKHQKMNKNSQIRPTEREQNILIVDVMFKRK